MKIIRLARSNKTSQIKEYVPQFQRSMPYGYTKYVEPKFDPAKMKKLVEKEDFLLYQYNDLIKQYDEEIFDFTGYIDCVIAKDWLIKQEREPRDLDEWIDEINKLIDKRKGLWDFLQKHF